MENALKYGLNIQLFASNTFAEDVTAFMPVLDELYAQEAITAVFEVENTKWKGTKKIQIPTVTTQGNADYDREAGYTMGSINVAYQEKELTHDRGRRFNIDAVEADEVNIDLVGEGMAQFERLQNIPEIDAIRFAKLSTLAGHKVTEDYATSEEAISAYDEAELKALEMGLRLDNSIMFVSAKFYRLLKNYIKPSLSANSNNGVIDRSVKYLDNGLEVRVVPNDRFYDQIQLLTGGTGQEAGGFGPIKGTSKPINFLLVDKAVPQAVVKRKADKIITPEQNQTHDGYALFYRTFHDIYIMNNQAKRLYVSISATAVPAE